MKTLTFVITLVFCVAISLHQTSGLPQLSSLFGGSSGIKVIEEDGSNYNEDDCRDKAKDAERSGACAVIFEKTECDDGLLKTGDSKEIEEDKWTNLFGTGFNEDVESVIVRPGCALVGYDESDKDDPAQGITVSAVGKTDWVYKELKNKYDLKDDIEAVQCYCGSKARQVTEVKPFSVSSLQKLFKTQDNYCNLWIHAFNRLPVQKRPCAILFETGNCYTNDGLINDWYLEILPNNKIVNLPEVAIGAKADSAESVLVRPGCTFTGYDQDDGRGKEVTATAAGNSQTPNFLSFSIFNQNKESIDSYKCTCN